MPGDEPTIDAPAQTYSVLLEGPETTVCAEAPATPADSTAYQSEAELEVELIEQLCGQGYTYLDVHDQAGLIANLREHIELKRRGVPLRQAFNQIERYQRESFWPTVVMPTSMKGASMSRIVLLPRTSLQNPYFVSLSRQKRLCPLCGRPTELTGTLNPNAAYELCRDLGCSYCMTLVAPEWARVDSKVEAGSTGTPRPRLRLVK